MDKYEIIIDGSNFKKMVNNVSYASNNHHGRDIFENIEFSFALSDYNSEHKILTLKTLDGYRMAEQYEIVGHHDLIGGTDSLPEPFLVNTKLLKKVVGLISAKTNFISLFINDEYMNIEISEDLFVKIKITNNNLPAYTNIDAVNFIVINKDTLLKPLEKLAKIKSNGIVELILTNDSIDLSVKSEDGIKVTEHIAKEDKQFNEQFLFEEKMLENGMRINFNIKYLINMLKAIDFKDRIDQIKISFDAPYTPFIAETMTCKHTLLPVRVA